MSTQAVADPQRKQSPLHDQHAPVGLIADWCFCLTSRVEPADYGGMPLATLNPSAANGRMVGDLDDSREAD